MNEPIRPVHVPDDPDGLVWHVGKNYRCRTKKMAMREVKYLTPPKPKKQTKPKRLKFKGIEDMLRFDD